MTSSSSSMVDRGDSHLVWYLGSTMLHQGATGIGVLQKPLREMYFTHRKAGEKAALLQVNIYMKMYLTAKSVHYIYVI